MKKIVKYFNELKQKNHKLDKSRIYIGVYSINNQESLFYKIDFNTYYDLKLKKNVSYEELQKDSLIPYNDIIKCNSNYESNVIKVYELDRMEKVSLSRVYIGSSYQIIGIINRKIEHYGSGIFDSITTTSVETRIIDENLLLLATSDHLDYTDFINLENGDLYKTPYCPEYGDIYISTNNKLKPAAFELKISGINVEKGKLLEKYREYKRR